MVLSAVTSGLLLVPTTASASALPLRGNGLIAFESNRDGSTEIYVMNADGSNQTRLTTTNAASSQPAFSPDGTHVAFASNRDGNNEIYM